MHRCRCRYESLKGECRAETLKPWGSPAGNSAVLLCWVPAWSLQCSVTATGPTGHHSSKQRLQTSFSLLRGSKLPAVAPPSQEDLCELQLALLSATKSQRFQTTQPYSTEATSVAGGAAVPNSTQVLLRVQRRSGALQLLQRDQVQPPRQQCRVINTPLPAIPLCPEASLMWLRHPFSVPPLTPPPGGS